MSKIYVVGAVARADHATVSVLIVDDHDVVALGLHSLLEETDEITVVGMADSAASAIAAVERHHPDVVLMDYRLPDRSGADAAREILRGHDAPAVVMITAAADRRVLGQALDAGCCGFISKNADRSDLVDSIVAAADGDSYFTRDVLKHLVHLRRFDDTEQPHLSDRECEVLQLTADGLLPGEIARQLNLSVHTVRNHLRHAMAALDAHTKLDAVVRAVRADFISIRE